MARSAGPAIYLQVPLKTSRIPIDSPVTVHGGAHQTDRFFEEFLDVEVQPVQFPDGNGGGQPLGMQPGQIERFVRVDIADAGDELLIEQGGLERPRPPPAPGDKVR
jgi:hypothetical protein